MGTVEFAAYVAAMIGLGVVLQMAMSAPRLIHDLLRDFVTGVLP